MLDEDKVYEDDTERDWVFDIADEAGFGISKEGEIFIPDGAEIDDLLEEYAHIVANIAIRNYVNKMCQDMRGGETLH